MTDVVLAGHADPSLPDHPDEALLRAALHRRGIAVGNAAWTDPAVDWGAARLVVVWATWDYPGRRHDFLAWAERTARSTAVHNPPAVLRWNTHKEYLARLQADGVAVVPTIHLAADSAADLAEVLADAGWSDVVVKPAVGVGAFGIVHATDPLGADADAIAALRAAGDVLVQPFQSTVCDGELSILWFDGRPAYGVRKVPGNGDFRVHQHWGGTYTAVEPPPAAVAVARAALPRTPEPLLYGRVDLLADGAAWRVMEVELTEPDLYLRVVPDAAERFADAVRRRLS